MSVDKKSAILSCIDAGAPAIDVLGALFEGGVPSFECEFWDYKLLVEDGAESFAELCRDVVSFYNSYGGYIIVGVANGGEFVDVEDFPYDDKRIKQKVRSYCGHDVIVRSDVVEFAGKKLVCISIPKRAASAPVAVMTADGPQVKGGHVFRRGSVYFRADESCQLIRDSEDMRFLSSDRPHHLQLKAPTKFVSHNLPDRSMICERFIGRSDVKQELWVWLSDRMARYRVIAAPGGYGKTSAAYSFCEDVISSAPLGFMQVMWLSAKTKQFDPAKNQFVNLAYSGTALDSFSDIPSLLEAIAEHIPLTAEEMEGLSEPDTVLLLQKSLGTIPSFIVIDDVDSLEPDDQRRVVELAMLLGGEQAKFLLTTRKNYIAPSTSVTTLPGLNGDDLIAYLDILKKRYGREVPPGAEKTFYAETGGSPLFVESIFRMLKLGERFSDAILRWKGQDGEVVRAAAFRKELEQLSFSAKKVLFAIAQFPSLSSVEIRKVAELEQPQVEGALTELDQLFLLSSEQIGDIPRFSVPSTLVKLLTEHQSEFVPNHREIVRRAAAHRQEAKIGGKSRGNSHHVGKAIAQTMAQLAIDPKAALVTIQTVMGVEKQSADLWMVYARCLSALVPVDVEAVRKAFAKSYALGKRERALFDKWISFENEFGNSNAAIDVAERAKDVLVPPPWDWLVKVASAYYNRGGERLSRMEQLDAYSDFELAAGLLEKALRFSPDSAKSSTREALDRARRASSRNGNKTETGSFTPV